MPDLTMCEGHECPLKDKCYRYNATPDKHQSYFIDPPYDNISDECESFYLLDIFPDENEDETT